MSFKFSGFFITTTRLYNFEPYSKTEIYRGIHYFSYFCSETYIVGIRYNRLTKEVLTSAYNLCFEQKYEKYQSFLFENFQFFEVKYSIYLNRRVFVIQMALRKV